jgi:hypothetical protein
VGLEEQTQRFSAVFLSLFLLSRWEERGKGEGKRRRGEGVVGVGEEREGLPKRIPRCREEVCRSTE